MCVVRSDSVLVRLDEGTIAILGKTLQEGFHSLIGEFPGYSRR